MTQPSAESMPTRIGDYLPVRRIGAGAMGIVYLARQISLRRDVALKVLHPALAVNKVQQNRFYREVRLLARMDHPGIVRVFEGGSDGRYAFFAMELLTGYDLKTQLAAGKRFPEREVLTTALRIAEAMCYAWNRFGMIHRDIKPANIQCAHDGTCKLLDMGISKCFAAEENRVEAKTMFGSPSYMSPEQARSDPDLDFSADLYSLGCTMYHLLTGKVPYEAAARVDVIAMHFNAPIPDVRAMRPEISEETSSLTARLMAKKREDRFSSWEEFADALTARISRYDNPSFLERLTHLFGF